MKCSLCHKEGHRSNNRKFHPVMVLPVSASPVSASPVATIDIKENAPVDVGMDPSRIMNDSKMTMKDLTALCKKKGLKGYSNKTRAELVEMVSSTHAIAVSASHTESNTESATESTTESATESATESTTEADREKLSMDDLWSFLVSNEPARRTFNKRVEYILNQFGTALSCNRFAIGECIEYAATDLLNEIGIRAEAVSSEKRIDIRINNVAGLTAISSKYVSTGNHVILYNAQRTVATDMTLHPTLLFLANEWWLLIPSVIEKLGVSIKEYLKNTTDSVQLSFKMLASLRRLNYPYCLAHAIAYDKESCPKKATSEVLYRIVKDLLDPHLDPIIRQYLETQNKLLHCRKASLQAQAQSQA